MRGWFEWNGVKCTEYGIVVSELPPITMPTERVEYISVPGRSGSLTKLEGEDVYEDLVLSAKCFVENEDKIADIMRWLKGSGKVVFANRQGGFYYARVSNQIPFEKILRGRAYRTFAVNFRCKPFWYADEDVIEMNGSGAVMNEGSVYSEPVITVRGSGDGELLIGSYIVKLTGLDGSMTIDSELQEAYSAEVSCNEQMSGEFPRLSPGLNGVSWTGGITGVTIRKNTRYL